MSPCLVHFPDHRESRVVMNLGGEPRPGDEFISGWIVERQESVPDAARGYDREVWVKPKQ